MNTQARLSMSAKYIKISYAGLNYSFSALFNICMILVQPVDSYASYFTEYVLNA